MNSAKLMLTMIGPAEMARALANRIKALRLFREGGNAVFRGVLNSREAGREGHT